MDKASLLAALNAIEFNDADPLASDPAVGAACAGAAHAIWTRMTGDPATLPDLEALKNSKRYVIDSNEHPGDNPE